MKSWGGSERGCWLKDLQAEHEDHDARPFKVGGKAFFVWNLDHPRNPPGEALPNKKATGPRQVKTELSRGPGDSQEGQGNASDAYCRTGQEGSGKVGAQEEMQVTLMVLVTSEEYSSRT